MAPGLAILSNRAANIDPVAHQVSIALLDHIAEMDADAELDAALGRKAGVALDHAVLHLDGAAHGVDHTAELNKTPVAGALYHVPVCTATVGSIRSLRSARSRASVLSSSMPASRLYPTTSAARIAASFRVSVIKPFATSHGATASLCLPFPNQGPGIMRFPI